MSLGSEWKRHCSHSVATYEGDARWREKEKCKFHFLFLKPTSHSEKKATNALAHNPGWPLFQKQQQPKEKKKEKRTLTRQSKSK